MRTICIGDSFTRGFGVQHDENWVTLLNTPCSTFLNKGINGDTTGGMLGRFYSDVTADKPNYVIITGGLNDFITGANCPMVQTNYMALVHQAFHHNIIPIIGIQPGFNLSQVRKDWAEFADFSGVSDYQKELRNWIIKFCHTFGVFYIDFYDSMEKIISNNPSVNFYLDGIHLTQKGHLHIAEIAVNALADFS